MKHKKLISTLVSLTLLTNLSSCGETIKPDKYVNLYYTTSFSNSYAAITNDFSVSETIISPFNTSFNNSRLFLQKDDENKTEMESGSQEVINILNEFTNSMFKYHVLFDRHYYYQDKSKLSEEETIDTVIPNIKVLNTKISPFIEVEKTNNSTSTTKETNSNNLKDGFTVVDKVLYDALKLAYEFTILSENKFSLFVGQLSDLYQEIVEIAKHESLFGGDNKTQTSPYAYLAHVNNRYFYKSPEIAFSDELNVAKCCTPSLEELKDDNNKILEFDDTNHSVKLNNTKRCQDAGGKISMTLAGLGKGLAIENFIENHSEYSMIINGGTSSMKTNKTKPSSPWIIAFTNPTNKEIIYKQLYKENEGFIDITNSYEVQFKIDHSFNTSTSGYYENYYYIPYNGDVNNPNSKEVTFPNFETLVNGKENETIKNEVQEQFNSVKDYKRINHIVDPNTGSCNQTFDFVSIYNNNAALGDMYTTALMNCKSIEEAESLRKKLDTYYKDSSEVIYSFKRTKDQQTFTPYVVPPHLTFNTFGNEETDKLSFYSPDNLKNLTNFKNSLNFNQIYKASSSLYKLLYKNNNTNNKVKPLALIENL